ncbi:hypothetical protein [Herbaspirillum sp. RV1423]|uniref:hypothetical protein n=1 Tax=Herbaspirillum sp. RV1423 TaxID=1443993 RepID=UPI0035900DA0
MKHSDVVASVSGSLMEVRRNNLAPILKKLLFKEIAMKSKSIIVAALFSALTLPVFAQTGTPATPAAAPATPAAATAAPKAEHAAKHKTVKHAKKVAKEKTEKTADAPAAKPATDAAAPAKAK